MSNKKVLILAIVLGLITALSINLYLNKLKKEMSNVETAKVVVAAQTIPARTELTGAMLEVKEIPKAMIQQGSFTDTKNLVGKISTAEILAGEQVKSARVVDKRDINKGLGYIVPKGERAISVAVDDVIGVSGLIKPGDRVDVLATIDIDTQTNDKKITLTKVILQDIEVLAVGKSLTDIIESQENSKQVTETKTVTLAVTLAQAQPLTLASERGKLRLVLRSPVDKGTAKLPVYLPSNFLQQ